MRNKYLLNSYIGIFAILMSLIISSCSTPKNVKYFEDLSDSTKYSAVSRATFSDPLIQSDDILSIVIETIDRQTSETINQSVTTPSAPPINTLFPAVGNGYLVDRDGNVELPILGLVKVAGLTTYKARDLIRTKVSEFYKNPSVQVRYVNFKITVIGEVAKPATYIMPNEKVTILDALGMAGDLTIFGKRENILITRSTDDGKQQLVRLNLNSTELFNSPYYYLKQNDVVYVEPNKAKVASTDASRNRVITVTAAALSLMVVIISRLL